MTRSAGNIMVRIKILFLSFTLPQLSNIYIYIYTYEHRDKRRGNTYTSLLFPFPMDRSYSFHSFCLQNHKHAVSLIETQKGGWVKWQVISTGAKKIHLSPLNVAHNKRIITTKWLFLKFTHTGSETILLLSTYNYDNNTIFTAMAHTQLDNVGIMHS